MYQIVINTVQSQLTEKSKSPKSISDPGPAGKKKKKTHCKNTEKVVRGDRQMRSHRLELTFSHPVHLHRPTYSNQLSEK